MCTRYYATQYERGSRISRVFLSSVGLNRFDKAIPVALGLGDLSLRALAGVYLAGSWLPPRACNCLFGDLYLRQPYCFTPPPVSTLWRIYSAGSATKRATRAVTIFGWALITLGEGWHNNHHKHMGCTRQGFYWWEIDITYYFFEYSSGSGSSGSQAGAPQGVQPRRATAPQKVRVGGLNLFQRFASATIETPRSFALTSTRGGARAITKTCV